MDAAEIDAWLQGLPLHVAVEIDDERVYLKPGAGGAELGALFFDAPTDDDIARAMRQGFQSALECEAGWGMSADGESLVLSQWLPDVTNWVEAGAALEALLNQVAALRANGLNIKPRAKVILNRDEQRVRSTLLGIGR